MQYAQLFMCEAISFNSAPPKIQKNNYGIFCSSELMPFVFVSGAPVVQWKLSKCVVAIFMDFSHLFPHWRSRKLNFSMKTIGVCADK